MVSLIPRSVSVRLRSEMVLISASSAVLASSASGEVGRQWNETNTEGINSRCFRTHTGAISPSGNCGEFGCKGERGDLGGKAANAAVDDSEGEAVEPAVMDGMGETCRAEGLVLSGGRRTEWSAKTVWNTAARPRDGSQRVLRARDARISWRDLVRSGKTIIGWSGGAVLSEAGSVVADDAEAAAVVGGADGFGGGVRPATTIHAK